MDTFRGHDLSELTGATVAHCVSIYMPTHPASEQGQQDLIRLRNLLDEAEAGLQARGVGTANSRRILSAGRELLTNKEFWNHRSTGLALFFAPDWFKAWRIPTTVESLAWVGNRFYVKPLFRLVNESAPYYLLAVSQNRVRLFHGNRYELTEQPVAGMPQRMSEVVEHHLPDGQRQSHTGQTAVRGKEGAVFTSQGSARDHWQKHDLAEFFRVIDRCLHVVLNGQKVPLVFAGVDFLFPLYCEANRYPHLLSEAIHANSDHLDPTELKALADKVLATYWLKERTKDMARFQESLGTTRVTGNLADIVHYAYVGCVESLFVAEEVRVWGHLDDGDNTVQISEAPTETDEDLLNLAAVLAHERGGKVHVMDSGNVPGATVIAALLRYQDAVVSPVVQFER